MQNLIGQLLQLHSCRNQLLKDLILLIEHIYGRKQAYFV